MSILGALLAIALAWCFLQGNVTVGNLLLGAIIAAFFITSTRRLNGMHRGLSQVKAILRLIGFLLWELVVSSFRVMWDILTPTDRARPRVIKVPISDLDDISVTILANATSLTPGSLALDVSADGKYLYVHHMYAEDAEEARRDIAVDLGDLVRAVRTVPGSESRQSGKES